MKSTLQKFLAAEEIQAKPLAARLALQSSDRFALIGPSQTLQRSNPMRESLTVPVPTEKLAFHESFREVFRV